MENLSKKQKYQQANIGVRIWEFLKLHSKMYYKQLIFKFPKR